MEVFLKALSIFYLIFAVMFVLLSRRLGLKLELYHYVGTAGGVVCALLFLSLHEISEQDPPSSVAQDEHVTDHEDTALFEIDPSQDPFDSLKPSGSIVVFNAASLPHTRWIMRSKEEQPSRHCYEIT